MVDQIDLRNLKNRLKAAQANLENRKELMIQVSEFLTKFHEEHGALRHDDPLRPQVILAYSQRQQAEIQCVYLEWSIEEMTKSIKEMEDEG